MVFSRIKKNPENYMPLGYDSDEFNIHQWIFGIYILLSAIIFISSYLRAWSFYQGLIPFSFFHYVRFQCLLFVLVPISIGLQVQKLYTYHKTGSQSIYLMKRLPVKHEFAKRVLAMPAFVLLIETAVFVLLMLICFTIYSIGGAIA